ncbi:MAG TPA: hypothetical protein VFD59_01495, partial [Nocardioidaceae bacterium]|nr:hypothetical protein [Nocardioidaceae bacterium]
MSPLIGYDRAPIELVGERPQLGMTGHEVLIRKWMVSGQATAPGGAGVGWGCGSGGGGFEGDFVAEGFEVA